MVRLSEFLHRLKRLGIGLEGGYCFLVGDRALPLVRAVTNFMKHWHFDIAGLRTYVNSQLDEFLRIDYGYGS